MKFIFDITHPAGVHYFKDLIGELKSAGHTVTIAARNKDITQLLLRNYGFSFTDFGDMKKSILSRITFMLRSEWRALWLVKKAKPDVIVSMGSIYFAHAAFACGVPFVVFDDTEHNRLNRLLYKPFAKRIFTPQSFLTDLGKKQYRYNAVMELFYLHPARFNKWKVAVESEFESAEPFAIVRFISWSAFHDRGINNGLVDRIALMNLVKKYMKVYLSVEGEIPPEYKPFLLKLAPQNLHSYLEKAAIYIGEGATTASECAILGTPAVYINPLPLGYIKAEEEWGLLYDMRGKKDVLNEIERLLQNRDLKQQTRQKRNQIIGSFIDPTAFFFWYFNSYPDSDAFLKDHPDYQEKFVIKTL